MSSSIILKGIYIGNKPVVLKRYLYHQYKELTDGTQCWRDDYLLERWADSQQPVVYYGQHVNGYRLLKRLGDWCWLARNTNNKCVYLSPWAAEKANDRRQRVVDRQVHGAERISASQTRISHQPISTFAMPPKSPPMHHQRQLCHKAPPGKIAPLIQESQL